MAKWKRISINSLVKEFPEARGLYGGPTPLHALVEWYHTYSWDGDFKFKVEKGALVVYENTD